MNKKDDDKVMIGVYNVLECRVMTPEYFNNLDENIMMQILGDDDKLDQNTIVTRNEMFNFLREKFNNVFVYWIEVRPNTPNEINKIHINDMRKQQMKFEDFGGVVAFKAGRYRVFKYPQFGFSVNVYE